MDRSNHAAVDDWLESLTPFARPFGERLIRIIRRTVPHLEEGIRWGSPSWKGSGLVCGIGAFQKHVSLVLWRGAEVPDPCGLLVHGEGRSSMRSAKFKAPGELDEKMIAGWLTAAAALDSDEIRPVARPKRVARPEAEVPAFLAKALRKNAVARSMFQSLPPSHRREYCEWIAGAKQEATVARRVARTVEMLEQGKGLNDKYR